MYDPIPALQHSSFASKVQLLTTNPQSDLSLSLKHSRCLHYVWHQCLLRSVMIIPIAYWYRSHCWSTFPANKSAWCCGSEYFRHCRQRQEQSGRVYVIFRLKFIMSGWTIICWRWRINCVVHYRQLKRCVIILYSVVLFDCRLWMKTISCGQPLTELDDR